MEIWLDKVKCTAVWYYVWPHQILMANTLQVWQFPEADQLPNDLTQELICLLNFLAFCDKMPLKLGYVGNVFFIE